MDGECKIEWQDGRRSLPVRILSKTSLTVGRAPWSRGACPSGGAPTRARKRAGTRAWCETGSGRSAAAPRPARLPWSRDRMPCRYEGVVRDGIRAERGTMHYADGTEYAGAWVDGLRCGVGVAPRSPPPRLTRPPLKREGRACAARRA